MFKNFSPSALGISGHQSELIELALTYGFGGMDLDARELATRARLRGMPFARRLLDSAHLRMGVFDLPLEWDTDDETFRTELERLPECAEAAAAVGCTRCVATLVPAGDKRPYHENFEFHRRRFAEICAALSPAGVRLGVGFQAAEYLRKNQAFQFIHDLDALTLLLNMVGAGNIGLLLDVWDLAASGQTVEAIQKIPPQQIVAVQVAEMPAAVPFSDLDQNSRWLPGVENGRVNVAQALAILKAQGYDGPVTPKPSRGVFQSRKRDVVVRQTAEALDKVWREAGLSSERRIGAAAAP